MGGAEGERRGGRGTPPKTRAPPHFFSSFSPPQGLSELFGDLLGPLEAGTRPTRDAALAALAAAKGDDAVSPWNRGFAMAGDSEKALDPYFPFSGAVSAWARSFAALGIGYARSLMRLDLLDRKNKYSNGFW